VAPLQLHVLPGRECGGGPTSATCVAWKGVRGWPYFSYMCCLEGSAGVALLQLHVLLGRECGGGPTSAPCVTGRESWSSPSSAPLVTWKGGLE
jgi:hypothetical protein